MFETKFRFKFQDLKQVYIFILTGTIMFVSYITISINNMIAERYPIICKSPFPISLYIPLFFAIGILTGYLYSKLLCNSRKNGNIKKLLDKIIEDKIERNILLELLEKREITQSELSRKYGKVKVHRVVSKLEARNIVKRYQLGRTYVLKLNI